MQAGRVATHREDLGAEEPPDMGLEKKSEPPPREMWPSLPRATSFLGAASSSTSALNANRLGAGPAHPAHPNQFHTVPRDDNSPRAVG